MSGLIASWAAAARSRFSVSVAGHFLTCMWATKNRKDWAIKDGKIDRIGPGGQFGDYIELRK
jgi:hypothetical protein